MHIEAGAAPLKLLSARIIYGIKLDQTSRVHNMFKFLKECINNQIKNKITQYLYYLKII